MEQNNAVIAIAGAIAKAEGFSVVGSIPHRANNPGDLCVGDKGLGKLGEGITVFPTVEDGWNYLYKVISGWLDGSSQIYKSSMTIGDIADCYAPGAQASRWAKNVAGSLGVTVDTTLSDVVTKFSTPNGSVDFDQQIGG